MKNLRVTIRLEELTRQKIEWLVREGKFSSISHCVREALEKLLVECV